jgi:MraZ protein
MPCRRKPWWKKPYRREYAMFLGEFRLSVGRGGWLCLPASLRHDLHALYAPDDTELILTTFYKRCLVCFPREEWLKEPEKLRRRGASPRDLQDFQTRKAVCPQDAEGRLRIPPAFRRYAQITRDVLLMGVVNRLELWSPRRWERFAAAAGWRL